MLEIILKTFGINPNYQNNNSENEVYSKNYFNEIFINDKNILSFVFVLIGGMLYKINSILIHKPKLNLVLMFFFIIFNIKKTFDFYAENFFFSSFIYFWFFIMNINNIFLSLINLTGNKENDYSIFYVKNFKTEKIFYLKLLMTSIITIIINYFNLIYFRKFYFYFLGIYFLANLKNLFFNYYKNYNFSEIQPFENFITFIFGILNFSLTNIYYYLNISYGYEYNSFVFVNNLISVYYISYFDKLIFYNKYELGELYLQSKESDNSKKSDELFEKKQIERLRKKQYNIKDSRKNKLNSFTNIDFFITLISLSLIIISYFYDSILCIFLALYFFEIYKKNSIYLYSIRFTRIISSLFLLLFLITIYYTKYFNLYYVNHIVAVNDERFLLALKLLIKFVLFLILFFCFFFSLEFLNIFNIYNYTSYKYIVEEGICNNIEEYSNNDKNNQNYNLKNNGENNDNKKLFENFNFDDDSYSIKYFQDMKNFKEIKITTSSCNSKNKKNINIDIDINSNIYSTYKNINQKIENIDNKYTSLFSQKINEIYNISNSLDEIFSFSIEKSSSYINSILETLNFNNNNSSKIDSVYIEFLISKSTKNSSIFSLLFDYFLLYFNFWFVHFAVKEENQNHIFFFIISQLVKCGIFLKFFFIVFEYSKSKVQIMTIIILNTVFYNRLITYFDNNMIDYYTITIFINLNKVIYFYFFDNSFVINIYLFFIGITEFRRNKDIIIFAFLIASILLKTILYYFKRINYRKNSVFVFFLILTLFIVFSQEKNLEIFYEFIQENIIKYTKIDVIGIFEYISFSSISIPRKYFINGNDEIYIRKSNFFEEVYIREFLKFFIKYKILKD